VVGGVEVEVQGGERAKNQSRDGGKIRNQNKGKGNLPRNSPLTLIYVGKFLGWQNWQGETAGNRP
jgi:hypothetical protein